MVNCKHINKCRVSKRYWDFFLIAAVTFSTTRFHVVDGYFVDRFSIDLKDFNGSEFVSALHYFPLLELRHVTQYV